MLKPHVIEHWAQQGEHHSSAAISSICKPHTDMHWVGDLHLQDVIHPLQRQATLHSFDNCVVILPSVVTLCSTPSCHWVQSTTTQIFHLMFYAHWHRSSVVINQQGHSVHASPAFFDHFLENNEMNAATVLPRRPKTLPLKSNSHIPQESPASVALQSSMPKAIPSTTPRKPKVHAQLDSPSVKHIQSMKSFNSDSIQNRPPLLSPKYPCSYYGKHILLYFNVHFHLSHLNL